MKTLEQLREERAQKIEDLQKIADTAKKEERDLKDDENDKVDAINQEIDDLNEKIARAERTERNLQINAGAYINKRNQEKEKEEVKKFSFAKLIRSAVNNTPLEGFEAEMVQEARSEASRHGLSLEGYGVPSIVLEARDQTAGTTTEGGHLVPTDLQPGFIDVLRNKMVLTQVGAKFLTGLVGNLDVAKKSSGASASWEGETDLGDEESSVWTKKSMTPNRLGCYTQVSRRLLAQTNNIAEQIVIDDLTNAVYQAVQTAAINGSGSNDQPEGILNTSGIGSVAGGTNGAAPDWDDITNLEQEVAADNADYGTLAYLTNAKVKGKLKRTKVDTGSGIFVWPQNDDKLNGYNAFVTNSVPSNLDKGSSTGVCSAIIFGNFNDLWIGQWGGLDIIVDPYTDAKYALVDVHVHSWWDVAIARAESFAAMKDALTT